MSAQMPPDDTLDGLWAFNGQLRLLDNDLAKRKMPSGKSEWDSNGNQSDAFHGTYTRPCYHYVALRSGVPKPDTPPLIQGPPQQAWGWKNPDPQPAPTPVNNFTLEIFDEEGNFAHADWNGALQWGKGDDEIGAWQFTYAPITLNAPVDNPHLPKGDTLVLTPSLTLTPGTSRKKDDRFPRNGADETTPCPLPFISDGPASPPSQHIYYDDSELVWVRPDLNLSLHFKKQNPSQPDPKMDAWRNIFVHANIQWSLPFVGWNPQQLDRTWDPRKGNPDKSPVPQIVNSGTKPSQTPDGQNLDGTPIFAVPDRESRSYEGYSIGETHGVFLPWGARLEYEPHRSESTHSQMLSSTHELVNSWAMNLGLSAGMEKLFSASVKGSYHDKITSQQETETRYSLTRRVTTQYDVYLDIPNLQLDKQFSDTVLSKLKKLNNGDSREWDDFVKTYGTHYANGLTYGQTDFAEMRFSLQAEATAHEQGFKLEEKASAMLEGIKFGESAGVDHDWSTKDGSKVSGEDVTSATMGFEGKPVAIFLDLRPIWELFSPVFFPPNITVGAAPEYVAAPFVWTKLRSDFKKYLINTVGLNQLLDPLYNIDYTPRFIQVTIPEFKIWTPNQFPGIYGQIQLAQATEGVELVSANNWETDEQEAVAFRNGSDLPGIDDVQATFAVTPKAFASERGYILDGQIYNYTAGTPEVAPSCAVTRRFSDRDNTGFESHSEDGWGFKISFRLEDV
jgi:hypothetical protein